VKRKGGESVSEFSKRFNKMYKKIPDEIKPTQTMEKITYRSSFDSEFYLVLRKRRSPSLVHMQDVSLEVESNIVASDKMRGKSDRDRRKKKYEASTSDSSIVHSQVDELTKLVNSLSTEIEKLKSEGRQPYINTQNTENRGNFRRPNNAPQMLPRNRERDDQSIHAPLQNDLVADEEEEEAEADLEIHCLGDTFPSPHLTESSYEQYLMDIQINELSKGEKAKENPGRYNLRSKKNKKKNESPNQPVQKEYPPKAMTMSSKEKESKNPQVLIRDPPPETKEILKPSPPFIFENEIQKIKIPVPFLELIKNEDYRKYLSKML
jgi:hypothetical protein